MAENLYELLGLTPLATEAELRQAFENKQQQYDPTRLAGLDADLRTMAAKKFHLVSRAFELLADPAQRSAYDARLRDRSRPGGAPAPPERRIEKPSVLVTPPPPPPPTGVEECHRPLLPASETLTTPQLIAKVEQSLAMLQEQLCSLDPAIRWQVASREGFDLALEGGRGSDRFFVYVNSYDVLREQDIFLLAPTVREVCADRSFALMRKYTLFLLLTLHSEEGPRVHAAVRQFNLMPASEKGGARTEKVMMMVENLETHELYFPLSGDFQLPLQQMKVPPLRTTRKRLGELLVERGILTPTLQAEGLRRQRETGRRVGEIWVSMGAVSHQEVADTVGAQYGLAPLA